LESEVGALETYDSREAGNSSHVKEIVLQGLPALGVSSDDSECFGYVEKEGAKLTILDRVACLD